jgi:asparagine synthetase A
VNVEIWAHVYANRPAQPGIWAQKVVRDLPGIPRADDLIELAPGWASSPVKHVTFTAEGGVHVELRAIKTDNPDVITEHHRLVDEHDWEWVGNPPARTEMP